MIGGRQSVGMTEQVILDCRGQHRRLSERSERVSVADRQVADRECGWLRGEAGEGTPEPKA